MGDYYLMTRCPYMSKKPNGFYTPCGHCYFCRKKMAKELAFRCEQEAFDQHVYNCLITYDDDHLPLVAYPDGNIYVTLNKVHFQDFMKRLRFHVFKKHKIRLRYLVVGEYGGKKGRPHYHLILFTPIALHGFELDVNNKGQYEPFYYLNSLLEYTWKKGACDAEHMKNTGASVRYMVQYLLTTTDTRDHVEKPFKLMSRGKGLGYKWLERNEDFIRYSINNDYYLVKNDKGYKMSVPRYYQKKYLPEYQLIARADNYYYDGQEYEKYIDYIFEHGERKQFIKELGDYREAEHRTAESAYRRTKIHDNGRSAGRVFACRAKNRKG